MTTGKGKGSRYNRKIQIQKPQADEGFDGAGSGAWVNVGAAIWASVVDLPPSRDERLTNGGNIATRRARVRFRYRSDITPDMRFVMAGPPERVMQIIAGPAELGIRDEVEFMAEDYSPAGNAA